MQRTTSVLLAIAAATACSSAIAQSNSRNTSAVPLSSGYNGALEQISSPTVWGRRGAAFPGGELAMSFQNQLCNPGGFDLAWFAADNFPAGSQMLEDHPKFGFLVAREVNGRFMQISDWSYCKHAFLSLNDPGSCGSCANGTSAETMYVGCSDVYTNGNNGSRTYLGPPSEINPWLGTWEATGSYFDAWTPGNPADGIKGNTPAFDAVERRVIIKESSLGGSVSSGLFFQIHVIHEGEPIENRGNNTMSRGITVTWNGTSWSTATSGASTYGSILSRWTGSTMQIGQNGGGAWNNTDDGRFAVAVKVTGPTNGLWHYEYAVHNLDNSRGGSAFRLPICAGTRILNAGFRDIDQNALNDWTMSVGGGQVSWSAPVGNAHNWNTIYNVWFDSDAAPVAGNMTIDQAAIGPGALTVSVGTSVPGYLPVRHLADGCGTPSMQIVGDGGFPTALNTSFTVKAISAPATPFIMLFSLPIPGGPIVPGCDLHINLASYGDFGLQFTDAAGQFSFNTGVDPTWGDVNLQALTLIPSPPILGIVGLSSAVTVRYNGTGCP